MLFRLVGVLVLVGGLLALTYVVPPLNSLRDPPIDLTGSFAVMVYWVAESGGKFGIPAIGAIVIAVLVSRPGGQPWPRMREAMVIVLALVAVLGVGALVNEHLVKPTFAVPRPNVRELARTPPNAPVLGMSAEEFYAMPTKDERSAHLAKVLADDVKLDQRIRAHWIAESGFSFPSGHSFAAVGCMTFFVALGMSWVRGWRLGVCLALVPWAVAVCYSRPILRVHSPDDVCVGGVEGMVAGVVGFWVVRAILDVFRDRA